MKTLQGYIEDNNLNIGKVVEKWTPIIESLMGEQSVYVTTLMCCYLDTTSYIDAYELQETPFPIATLPIKAKILKSLLEKHIGLMTNPRGYSLGEDCYVNSNNDVMRITKTHKKNIVLIIDILFNIIHFYLTTVWVVLNIWWMV